jgi:hypothetical protein
MFYRFALALALTTAGCTAAPPDIPKQTRGQTQTGLKVIPLTIDHDGRRSAFRVELAATPDQQARGLMFRPALADDAGMIFPMDPPRPASFWMRNTMIPLDIIFIGPDRRITNIAANTTPFSDASIHSQGSVSAVLELRAGKAAALGLAPGHRVNW